MRKLYDFLWMFFGLLWYPCDEVDGKLVRMSFSAAWAIAKDYAGYNQPVYRCHECGRYTSDPHTNSRNEDVCEACCDLCNHFVRCPECGWTGPESNADLNDFGERRCPECDCGNPLAEVTP